MNSQPPQPPPSPQPRMSPIRPKRPSPALGMPWGLLVFLVLAYAIAGLLLVAFSPPDWIWGLALGGSLLQCLTLAGPQALQLLSRWKAWWAVRFSCLGAGLLMVALAIATGYGGTEDIDAISLQQTAFNIAGTALGVLVLTVVCAIVGARTGDRLIGRMGRTRTVLALTSICLASLFFGGLIGLAALP